MFKPRAYSASPAFHPVGLLCDRGPPALVPGTGNPHAHIEGAIGIRADSGFDAVKVVFFAYLLEQPGLDALGAFPVPKIHCANGFRQGAVEGG